MAEGAGDLDLLALANGQVADGVARLQAVAGEHLVQRSGHQCPGPPPPARPAQVAERHAGVLGDGQVGAQGPFLEDAAQRGVAHAGGRRLAQHLQRAGVRRHRPGQNAHQGGLAGAVVADQAQAFAPAQRHVRPLQRPDRAERLADARQPYRVGHGGRVRHAGPPGQPFSLAMKSTTSFCE